MVPNIFISLKSYIIKDKYQSVYLGAFIFNFGIPIVIV